MKFNWQTKENKQLLDSLLLLKNRQEAEAFLRDLMTEAELNEFAKRLEAARLLTNNIQYLDIIKRTGLSSTTVARISKWLKGPLGGYRLILARLAKTHRHNPAKLGKGLS